MTAIIRLLPFILTAGLALYSLLPVWVCCLNRKLAQAVLRPAGNKSARAGRLDKIAHWLKKRLAQTTGRLRQAGFRQPQALPIYLIVQLGVPGLGLAGALLTGMTLSQPLLASLVLASAVNRILAYRVGRRQKAFARGLYKIYRFLDEQVSAGIKVTDALRGLPEAVRDPIVQPILIQFVALYELTLDPDPSFAILRESFTGPDVDLLATHVRQCLQTGIAGRSLVRMEELLFTRTFGLLQQETRQIRTSLLLTALLALIPALLLFLYPLLHEAAQAVQTVFG
jgi:Flp pilus assembly protein TadB